MSLGIHAFDIGRGHIDLDVPVELLLVCPLVLLGHVLRVVGLMLSEGVCSVLCIPPMTFNKTVLRPKS